MRVVVTGLSGTLGEALGAACLARGDEVIGVGRKPPAAPHACRRALANPQRDRADAAALLDLDPDLVLLCAGQIEEAVGRGGVPLAETTESMLGVNALFPALVALEAAERDWTHPIDVVAIGSIADGSPSAFGPVYHASKSALHHFVTGAGPILHAARPALRLRLYRPGVIKGPLSWAPTLRLDERGRRIRARRCAGAPEASLVAERVLAFVASDRWVGSDPEPLSFRLLKLFWGLAPNAYYELQAASWRRVSRFPEGGPPDDPAAASPSGPRSAREEAGFPEG